MYAMNMKHLCLFIAMFLLGFSGYSQKPVFLRVFDVNGSKIGKGTLIDLTDTSLVISGSNGLEIPYTRIGFIKTRRSIGHTIIKSGSIVAGFTAILLTVSGSAGAGVTYGGGGFSYHFSAGDILAISMLSGGIYGTMIGGVTALLRKPLTFPVNGDERQWRRTRTELESIMNTYRPRTHERN
jgi:hypothetical protein